MKSEGRHIGWLLGSMLVLLALVACSEDGSDDSRTDEPQGNLRLSSVTRANTRLTPSNGNSIKMYVMTKNAQYATGSFNYTTAWTNTGVSVKEHEQYYMYGYMPGSYTSSISATATDLNGDYSKGADLTITGLPVFASEDICVTVGVGRVTANTDETEAVEGNYGYLSGLNSENYVNLLMDHLYGRLILQFNVDADYNALRHIKLKTVTLTSTYGEKVDATVMLRAGNGLGVNSVSYAKNTSGADSKTLEILKTTDADKSLSTTATETSFGPFFCAPSTFDANGSNLSLTCTYDVLNTAGTKVLRANCTATNKLRVSGMAHGVTHTVTVTIAPTYIYVLSDDDLNNPTILIN